jgi:serine phosphatase RsbU (regulator of sigma subunit)
LAVWHCGIKEKSMTAAFLGIDLVTFKAIYINCAHPSGLLLNHSGISALESDRSRFLGEDGFVADVNEVDLSHMKSVLLYTDGLLETDKLPISEAKLSRWMNSSPDFYSELSTAFKDVELQDDVSFLLVERQNNLN